VAFYDFKHSFATSVTIAFLDKVQANENND